MNPVERLIEDHQELRRFLAALGELITPAFKCESREKDCLAKLKEIQRKFLTKLKEHEEVEERLLFEARRRAPESEKLFISIAVDHKAINGIIEILSSLINICPYCDPFSAQFAFSMIAHDLISHMDHEETNLFPLLESQMESEAHMKKIELPEHGRKATETGIQATHPH